MANPTFRSQTGAILTGNSFTPTKPAGVQNGDLLILHVGFEKGTDVVITASQWTLIRRDDSTTNAGHGIYRRVEDGTALTSVSTTNNPKMAWTVAAFVGQHDTDPVPTHAGANGASGNPDPPSVTPPNNEMLAIACCANKKAGTGTPPSGYTERWDRANTPDGIGWSYGCEKALSGTSAENPAAITATDSAEWVAATFLIRSATEVIPAVRPKPPIIPTSAVRRAASW